MITATCHCGAVTVEVPEPPRALTDCNCSLCRRLGALWAYYAVDAIRVHGHPEQTMGYVWGDKTLRTVRCRHCACVTHWEPLVPESGAKLGVNARNFEPGVLQGVRVRHFDGADSWTYLD